MKKFKSTFALLAMAAVAVAFYLNAMSLSKIANATQQEACDQQTTYTKSGDFNDNRVDINFTSYQGDSNRRVIIDPANGYELVFIGIDWTGSDANEATPSVGNGTQTITYDAPNNETIDHTTVTVKKVCDKVNICHNTSSQSNPVEAIRVNFDAFDGQGQNDHTQHGDFLYNGPVNPQNQQPTKPDGDLWCANHNPNNTPSPTLTPTVTTTPSVTPSIAPYTTPYISPTVSPTPTYEITPEVTPYVTPGVEPTVEPSITPEPTPQGGIDCENNPDAEICIECPGGGTCEVIIGRPTPSVTPTETPIITPTPTQGGQGGTSSNNNSNSNSSSNESKNEAAEATAFANTGSFKNDFSNGLLVLGTALTVASVALYGKKKKAVQK